jgi:hypothetical protein
MPGSDDTAACMAMALKQLLMAMLPASA